MDRLEFIINYSVISHHVFALFFLSCCNTYIIQQPSQQHKQQVLRTYGVPKSGAYANGSMGVLGGGVDGGGSKGLDGGGSKYG